MKTKTQSFPKRLAAGLVFILAASSVLTACPGKGGGGDAPPPPGVVGITACNACAGIAAPTPLVPNATSTSQSGYFPATISWQILGDGNVMAQTSQMMGGYIPTSPMAIYRGMIIARGGITLAGQVIGSGGGYGGGYPVGYGQPYAQGQIYGGQQVPYGQPYGAVPNQCIIPAGSYTFDTVVPGIANRGDFQVTDLEAVGPVRFRFQVRGQMVNPYTAGIIQVSARLMVTSINGIQCGNIGASVY